MEISKISDKGIKIKSKFVVFGVNPVNTRGTVAVDVVLQLDNTIAKKQLSLEGEPLIINGPGEYEIKGVKLTGESKNNGVIYSGRIDGMHVCIYKSSTIITAKDAIEECEIAVVETDNQVDQKILAAMNIRVAILYGVHAQESVKSFGKDIVPVSKHTINKDKLPAEMEIVLL